MQRKKKSMAPKHKNYQLIETVHKETQTMVLPNNQLFKPTLLNLFKAKGNHENVISPN